MAQIKKFFLFALSLTIIAGLGYLVVTNYSIIFSKTVRGVIVNTKADVLPVALMGRATDKVNSDIFTYAIAIKEFETGEIVTARSEDRQWGVVVEGQCAEAKFLPYPPWDFQRTGTYFGARLLKLRDCEPHEKAAAMPANTTDGGSADAGVSSPASEESVSGSSAVEPVVQ